MIGDSLESLRSSWFKILPIVLSVYLLAPVIGSLRSSSSSWLYLIVRFFSSLSITYAEILNLSKNQASVDCMY